MPIESGLVEPRSGYFQIRETDYLEPELKEAGSRAIFRIPDQWWLTEDPIEFPRLQLCAARNVRLLPGFLYYDVLPIVSNEVRLALSGLGGFRGEFHPVELVPEGSREGKPYWYFRLFTRVDGVDRERSEIDFFSGTTRPKRIWELRLGSIASTLNVFRLEKIEAIFVSTAARDALAPYPVRFTPAEEFHLGW